MTAVMALFTKLFGPLLAKVLISTVGAAGLGGVLMLVRKFAPGFVASLVGKEL